MKKIIIFSRNNFPNNDAGAVRDFAFAKIYLSLGYEVSCICLNNKIERANYYGVDYFSLYVPSINLFSKITSEFGYIKRMKKVLKEFNFKNIEAFHIVDIPLNAILYLRKIALKKNIKLYHDSVEYYSPSNFKNGIFSFGYINKMILNNIIIDKAFHVYTISKYLDRHFIKRGLSTLNIPAIIDNNLFKSNLNVSKDRISIIYAGSPGLKDNLILLIEALNEIDDDVRLLFEINIIGISKEEFLRKYLGSEIMIERVSDVLVFHGKRDREYVIKYLEISDFSFLLRPPYEVFAKAGFPTKVAESMLHGIPMLCNITSDLDVYLIDGINSIIIKQFNKTSVANELIKISNYSKEQIQKLHINAYSSSKVFNPNYYFNSVKDFLS